MTKKCILDGVEHEYHDGIVHTWGFNEDHNFTATEYICRRCGEIKKGPFEWKASITMEEHNATCDGNCDMCKSRKIFINTGDANSGKSMTNKKWEGELNAYREARAQGIQPAGTSMAAINEARRASETMGQAYDADVMPSTKAITKESVSSLKETGVI